MSDRRAISPDEAWGEATLPQRSILVVDDDRALRETVVRSLTLNGSRLEQAATEDEARGHLRRRSFDAVILDLHFEGDWRRVLTEAVERDARTAVIILTGRADIATTVEAMQLGASDLLEKPVDLHALVEKVERWCQNRRSGIFAPNAAAEHSERRICGRSPEMAHALMLADRIAATPSTPAFLVGESGAGKEVIAERIHDGSRRRSAPFLRVNLAAISESVLEAELFGAVRGAFTDAKRERTGYLAAADRGTILLDEIGELRVEHQAKLLRAIEDRRFFPVGSDRERRVDLRIIAATNRDPEVMLAEGTLREDLYYRLGTIIRVPPLRERIDEIEPLARYFLDMFTRELGREPMTLSTDALALLHTHDWPGNVRELRNLIERAVILEPGDDVSGEALRVAMAAGRKTDAAPDRLDPNALALDDALVKLERSHIERVLAIAGGSRVRAAELLQISRSTLYEKLKRHGLRLD